jgi:hypothetical protein
MAREATLNDILEIVEFIKENGATKEELVDLRAELRSEFKSDISSLRNEFKSDLEFTKYEIKEEMRQYATRNDLVQFKNEIISALDPIINHRSIFELELMAQRNRTERLESRVDDLEKIAQ